MKGLIKKDLLMIKSNVKVAVVMLLFFILASSKESMDISLILQVIVFVTFMSTFSYDEYNKWDAYAITLPNGRKNVVKSKYISIIILSLLSLIIGIGINAVIVLIKDNFEIENLLYGPLGVFASLLIINCIMYPLIFKFGIEKGRIGIFILSFGIAGLIALLKKYIDISILFKIGDFLETTWYYIVPIVLLIILFISFKISERVYLKKEF